MFLQDFSGQDFMLAALGLLLVWYAGIWLWLKLRRRLVRAETGPLPHHWEKGVDALEEGDLVGAAVEQPGVQIVQADDFDFAERPMEASDQLGLVADVQQEIRSICALLAEQDGTKEQFISMFGVLRDQYPKLSGSGVMDSLNGFIREQVPFHLSDEELEDLWG